LAGILNAVTVSEDNDSNSILSPTSSRSLPITGPSGLPSSVQNIGTLSESLVPAVDAASATSDQQNSIQSPTSSHSLPITSELPSSVQNIGTLPESLPAVDSTNTISDQQNQTQNSGSQTSSGDASTTDALRSGVPKSHDTNGVVQSQFPGSFPGYRLHGADIVHALLSKAGAVAEHLPEGCDVCTIAMLRYFIICMRYLAMLYK
jgi:hypothetical protein